MVKISIIGSGNVATHLYNAFAKSSTVKLVQLYSRNPKNLIAFKNRIETCSRLEDLNEVDVFFIAVKDDAVNQMVNALKHHNSVIAHTSGSVSMSNLANKNGVFYPLQTFSKDTPVDFRTIPLCLEASDKESFILLEKLALNISEKVFSISTQQRKSLHLSAVFVSNFTNYMYQIGEDLCLKNNVPFEILHALMTETTKKATQNAPHQVQTGPAIRNDEQTITSHLDQLKDEKHIEIYKLLTKALQTTYGKKL